MEFKPVSHRTRFGTRFQYGILGYTRVDWYEYWAPTVPGDELLRFRLKCSTSMYEQTTDILGQARFVTVWTRFANDFHTTVVRFQVWSCTVCYGLVRLNTTFTRLTGHLQGLHTVPPTFVRVMLELPHIRVCFDINWLVLMAWLHKFSNFQQRSYCMIIHELCTDVETVSGRTWPCIIRTWTLLVVWWSYETALVVWRSYKTMCTLVWIVRWSCDIRVLIRVLDVGLGNGFTRFHTIYIRYWHGWAHSWSGLHVRLYIRSRAVSHGLVRPLMGSYTDMAPVPVF